MKMLVDKGFIFLFCYFLSDNKDIRYNSQNTLYAYTYKEYFIILI